MSAWRAREKKRGEEGGGQRQKVKGINVAVGVDGTTGNKLLQKTRGADPTAAYKIEQGAAAGLIEAAVDKVRAELTEAFLLGDCVAADGDFAGNDECDERAVAVEAGGNA